MKMVRCYPDYHMSGNVFYYSIVFEHERSYIFWIRDYKCASIKVTSFHIILSSLYVQSRTKLYSSTCLDLT